MKHILYSWTCEGEDYGLFGSTIADKNQDAVEIKQNVYDKLKRVIGSSTGKIVINWCNAILIVKIKDGCIV